MRCKADAPLRRLQPQLAAHGSRQPWIARCLCRPFAFVQATKNDQIEIEQARFQRAQNRKPGMQIVWIAHRARLRELRPDFGVMACWMKCGAGAVTCDLANQASRGFSRRPGPQPRPARCRCGCGKSLGGGGMTLCKFTEIGIGLPDRCGEPLELS